MYPQAQGFGWSGRVLNPASWADFVLVHLVARGLIVSEAPGQVSLHSVSVVGAGCWG